MAFGLGPLHINFVFSVLMGNFKRRCISSHEVSRDWLATLLENSRRNNRKLIQTLKTMVVITKLKQLQVYEICYTTEMSARLMKGKWRMLRFGFGFL